MRKISIRRIRSALFSSINRVLLKRGYEVISCEVTPVPDGFTCLNIGSGGSSLPGFIDLDVPSEHYDIMRKGQFIAFDLRKDCIPFPDSSVDLIYCSHVLEHVEDEFVLRFIEESSRVLKGGGVLRIACPDAYFLYQVSSFENDYWNWRHGLLKNQGFEPSELHQKDYLIREIATGAFRRRIVIRSKVDSEAITWETDQEIIERKLSSLSGAETWSVDSIGDHINWLTYEKIRMMAADKYQYVIRSKYRGSVSSVMSSERFDRTCPQMSLYVDCIR